MPETATTSGVGLSIKVTPVSGLRLDNDARCNVKKRLANITYLNDPPPDAVLLAYVGTQELNADTCLFIGDRSNRMYPNSRNNLQTEFIYTASPVGVQHKHILVTQKFAAGTASDIPLYFKHSLATTVQIESIRILDKNFQEVSADHYLVELEKKYNEETGAPVVPTQYTELAVYNSLENSFNSATGEYEAYYIQYRDSWNDVQTILIDNQPAYREATLDDIWFATVKLAPWAKAYILEESGGVYYLDVPAAINQKFAVRYTAESKIYASSPVMNNDTSLWLPRIANGSFSWKYANLAYAYDIPEFSGQSFNPIEPYKLTDRAEAIKIADHLLKLAHEDVSTNEFMYDFTMVIEHDNQVIYALTQDANLVGSRYKNFDGDYVIYNNSYVTWSSSEILGIDRRSGMVQLSLSLKDYWKYYATYNYLEKFYEISSLNMNPVYDREVQKEIKVVYVVPKSPANKNTGSQTRSIHYLSVTSGGIIEQVSQDGNGGNQKQDFATRLATGTSGARTEGLLGMHYNWRASTYITASCTLGPSEVIKVQTTNKFPRSGWLRVYDGSAWRYAKFDNKTDNTLILSDDDNGAGGSLGAVPNPPISISYSSSTSKLVEVVNFVDEHSSMSTRSVSDSVAVLSSVYSLQGYPNHYHRYFVLAEMAINPPHGIHDATILDLREDGGNLDPTKYDEAKTKQPEAQWFADYMKYDGQPTPGNAAVVVKVPVGILDSFTEEQVEAIVEENVPFGVKPLIRYYGYKPHIFYVGPGQPLVAKWYKLGTEFTYDVWYADSPTGPWYKHNKIRLDDTTLSDGVPHYEVSGYNLYMLTGLAKDRTYYVKVTCNDKYNSWWIGYGSYSSVSGGYGHDDDAPSAPFNNAVGLKINVT